MAAAKYEVLSQTVEVLLSPGSALFDVPVFQRTYAWGSEEIGQLLDDIYGESAKSELPYFLGSIVLATREGSEALPSGDMVLDGQQRLTTISLLIAALIQRMKENGEDGAEENRTYLFSRRVKGKRSTKLTLQPVDRDSFELLVNDPNQSDTSAQKSSPIGLAMNRILKGIDHYAKKSSEYINSQNPYELMLQRLLYDVELVRITAPSERDAFRLFETLNDRGLSLSAADLIKNKLFSRCGNEIEDAVEAWSNMLACVHDDDVVNYLRAYWIAFRSFVRKRGLYDSYRNHIDSLDSTTATLFTIDLEESAKAYEQIFSPNPNNCTWGLEVAEALERLILYRARSCRPVLLALARKSESDMQRGVRLCESITVRFSIVGERNPNLLEAIYAEICKALRDSANPWDTIAKSRLMDEVPSDDQFKEKLAAMEITSVTPAWREILAQLNAKLGTGETRIQRGGRVHVEHILPQKPRAVALQDSKLTKEEAQVLAHRIGNFTLLSGRRNQQASNRRFADKRHHYTASEILITRKIGEFESWGKDEIERRSMELAETAVLAFPHPRKIAN